MNKNDFINLKFFSSIYLKLKEKKVNSLETKIVGLRKEIEDSKKLLQQNTQNFDALIEENTSIKNEYVNFIKL